MTETTPPPRPEGTTPSYGGAPTPPPPPPPAGPDPSQAQHPGQPGQPGRPLGRLFDGLRGAGLRRSPHRLIGGVCGGIADRTGLDPILVRVIAVVLGLFGGLGLLAYGLAWLLLPEPDGRIHAEQILHGDVHAGAVGAIVVTLLSFGNSGGLLRLWGPGWGWHAGPFGALWGLTSAAIFIGVIALVIYAISQGRGTRSVPPGGGQGAGSGAGGWGATGPGPASAGSAPAAPPPGAPGMPAAPMVSMAPSAAASTGAGGATATMVPPAPQSFTPSPASQDSPAYSGSYPTAYVAPIRTPRRPSLGGPGVLLTTGLALLAAGVAFELHRHGHLTGNGPTLAWGFALAAIALVLIVAGLAGRRSGAVTLLALAALVGALVAGAIPQMHHLQAVGHRSWSPTSASSASDGYGLAIGDGHLSLDRLDGAALAGQVTPVRIPASVGIGRLIIDVPPDVSVRVESSAGAGDVRLVGDRAVEDTTSTTFAGSNDVGQDTGGMGVQRTDVIPSDDGAPVQVIVEAKVGFGQVLIRTGSE